VKKTATILVLFSGVILTGCSDQFTKGSQPAAAPSAITKKLITYTDQQSPGPNKNYYWENGKAQSIDFSKMSAGSVDFESDAQGRSGEAKAILTYKEYENSKGKRQGSPLDPPSWPKNIKVPITFSLTNRTYHGYLYNRSHSISDSLLGKASYSSKFNFTTGTRSQNVGANQKGGMRAAEELAENYWKAHPNTKETIKYVTRPIYKGDETIPRGSIVDEKSSDGVIDKEIVVINSAEGFRINYYTGAFQ